MARSFFASLMLLLIAKLAAFEPSASLPFEASFPVEGGFYAHIEENSSPSRQLSVRVVVKQMGKDRLFSIDLPYADEPALSQFLKQCKEQIGDSLSADALGVIAIGDAPESELKRIIEEHFLSLTNQTLLINDSLPSKGIEVRSLPSTSSPKMTISYSFPRIKIETVADLRQSWNLAFFQLMLGKRLSESAGGLGAVHPSQLFLPTSSLIFSISLGSGQYLDTFSSLLLEISRLEKEGFNAAEFCAAQEGLLKRLHALTLEEKKSSQLASYWAEQFSSGSSIPYLSFLEASLQVVPTLDLNDINTQRESFLGDSFLEIDLPEGQDEAHLKIDQLLATVRGAPFLLSNATEVDINDAYYRLPLADWERKIIGKIVTTMAENNVLKLALKRKTMEKKGKQINHVHPMRFIGYIFADPHLKYCMQEIKESTFKWNGFVDGFSKRIKEEAGRNNLEVYIPGFAQSLGVSPDQVRSYIRDHNWEGLLRFLIKA